MSEAPLSTPDDAWVLARLEAQRADTLDRLGSLRADFDGMVAASVDSNADDEHDPEGSTIAFERAQVGSLIEQARRQLDDIEDARKKLAAGRYGLCESCGQSIAPARLEARPIARTCIECAAASTSR